MKTYRFFKEMKEDKDCPKVIFDEINWLVSTWQAEDGEDEKLEDFMYAFGGAVCIIETIEDLKEIHTYNPHPTENRWLDITEDSCNFDIAEYLPEKSYAILWMATNNAGGWTYYVPKGIHEKCTNIEKSVLESNANTIVERSNKERHVSN